MMKFWLPVLFVLTVIPAPGLASPAPSKPTVEFSGYSETLLRFYQQEDVENVKSLLALVEILSFSSAFPKAPELSIHLSGWGQLNMAEVLKQDPIVGILNPPYNQSRGAGDLNSLYISYHHPKNWFWGVLGRQYLYQNNRVLRFDGARLETRLPFGLGIRLFGGLVARPQFANPLSGYAVMGARISHRIGHFTEFGITFLEEFDRGEAGQEVIGFDGLVMIARWLEISGNLSLDFLYLQVRDANVLVEVRPLGWLRFVVGYDFTMPSAFISKGSIFSIFSDQTYHDATAQAWLSLLRRRLSLGIDARLVFQPFDPQNESIRPDAAKDSEGLLSGERARLIGRYRYGRRDSHSGTIGASLEWLRHEQDGHIGVRAFVQHTISNYLFALDLQYYKFHRPIYGFDYSLFAALSAQWRFAKAWSLTGSVSFRTSPFVEQDWLGLLKLGYRFELDVPRTHASAPAHPVHRTTPSRGK